MSFLCACLTILFYYVSSPTIPIDVVIFLLNFYLFAAFFLPFSSLLKVETWWQLNWRKVGGKEEERAVVGTTKEGSRHNVCPLLWGKFSSVFENFAFFAYFFKCIWNFCPVFSSVFEKTGILYCSQTVYQPRSRIVLLKHGLGDSTTLHTEILSAKSYFATWIEKTKIILWRITK